MAVMVASIVSLRNDALKVKKNIHFFIRYIE